MEHSGELIDRSNYPSHPIVLEAFNGFNALTSNNVSENVQENNSVQQLLSEIEYLKDFLHRSNESMKEQCVLLEKWKASRMREQELFVERYQQAKDVVLKLRHKTDKQEEKIKEMEKTLFDAGIVSIHLPPDQLNGGDMQIKEVKSLHPANSDQDFQNGGLLSGQGISNNVYFEQLKEANSKLEELSADCYEKDRKLQQKEAIINELEKKLAEVQELKTKRVLQLTEEYKKKEQSLLESFQRSANNRSTAEVQQQVQTLVRDLQEANTQLRQVQQEKSELFERCFFLDKHLKLARVEIDDVQQKDDMLIEDLRKKLDTMQNILKLKEKERLDLQKDLEIMTNRYEQNRMHVPNEPLVNANFAERLQTLEDELNFAKAVKFSMESEMERGQKELKHLKSEYDRLNTRYLALENENILLKFQAETFKADFDTERAERGKTAGAMDALKESIFELQQRNQQLQDELKAFTATIRPFPTYSSSKQRTKINPYEDFPEGPVGAAEKVPEVVPSHEFLAYTCLCGKAFAKYEKLSDHQLNCTYLYTRHNSSSFHS